ncbi:MAG TPA: hypothetical protein VF804_09760 [Holophagaceae bacterium]
MVWKQDLAKLKQQLGEEEPKAPPLKPLQKSAPKPTGPKDLDEEDAFFLAAMGRRPAPQPQRTLPEVTEANPGSEPPPAPAPETFEAALGELKGLKPLASAPILAAPSLGRPRATPPPSPPSALEPPPLAPVPTQAPPSPEPVPVAAKAGRIPEPPALPVRFQLAAGMAIEVDGMLDLRGHCRSDAVERLKDRLEDGTVLGWRSLQVILGSAQDLHEALLELLNSGQVPMISRYAQAPVPMGGNQAWLLYFGPPAP